MLMGIGFDRKHEAVLAKNKSTGGVFIWTSSALQIAGKKQGGQTTSARQMQMVCYLCELVYDLMISPEDNVSDSPGFESILGRGVTG